MCTRAGRQRVAERVLGRSGKRTGPADPVSVTGLFSKVSFLRPDAAPTSIRTNAVILTAGLGSSNGQSAKVFATI